ncbi:chorismate mutase [Brucella sp. 21LCYQ03]|nr:chorismate mutase [Brucella sp. 21LCYQ03]
MRKILRSLPASFLFLTLSIAAGHASDIQPLSHLINERLSHMQNVALFKEANHIPIEDLAQEARVIEQSAERAHALGLDPQSVKSFINIQMKAAKAVQYRYRADWLFKSESLDAPETLDNDRKQIAALGNELLELIADRLKKGVTIEESDQDYFVKSLSDYNLRQDEKIQLFNALRRVELAR